MKNVRIQAWDIGGQESLRSVWPSYFQNTHGLIYMIDSSDAREEHQQQSKVELLRLLPHEDLEGVPLLVLANKSDLGGLKAEQVSTHFGLATITSHPYHI